MTFPLKTITLLHEGRILNVAPFYGIDISWGLSDFLKFEIISRARCLRFEMDEA